MIFELQTYKSLPIDKLSVVRNIVSAGLEEGLSWQNTTKILQ